MLILSKIKSFLFKPLEAKYLSNSFSNETITIKGDLTININNITITITKDNDITLAGARFIDLKSELLFINSDNSDKLKKLKLDNPDKFEEKFKPTPEKVVSMMQKGVK